MTISPKLKSIIYLSFPAWGTMVGVGLILLFGSESATTLIVLIGVGLTALSSAPIVNSTSLGTGEKIGFILLYFCVSTIVIFILGLFLLCMHQCN
jgi:hypothetical protein